MQISIEVSQGEHLAVDALAVIGHEAKESEAVQPIDSRAKLPDGGLEDPAIAGQGGWLSDLRTTGEFTGKLYELAILHRPQGTAASKLVLVGGGKKANLSTVEIRRIAGVLVRSLKVKGVRSIALELESSAGPNEVVAAVEGAVLGGWEADKYKSDPKKNQRRVDSFTVVIPNGAKSELATAAEQARIIAEAQNFARDLVNEPANRLSPEMLTGAARDMATQFGLDYQALDREAMQDLGMGALLGVAQGSDNPPFLAILKYRPPHTEGKDHLALVGKGVTFDTGGISIKPSDGMEKMKYDMAGAAGVLGAMQALAQLKPTIPVTAYVPLVENMVSGNAQRPGDIVTALSGKTIEVLNTDAEGRLILADAITHANRNGATHIVDAATLTGAIGVALGHHNMGAFTNNSEFLARFMDASKLAGEKAWQLPMDEEYKEYLKSAFADLPNIGGRYGGSITAAWFIREFADPTPWIHLDIASTAWLDDAKGWLSKGPTGVAMRSMVQLALDWNHN
ncbi:MAG TPA: leucyl aminopeptidase [Bryobacteraceae bacterium]|nr:leucyl aminopeptidase [Bryobacteraceae bacterium]